MSSFKDINGRSWVIKVDAPMIRMIRGETCSRSEEQCKHRPGIDKDCTAIDLAAFDEKMYERLDSDIVLRVDVLYLLCRGQATSAGISDEQFGEAIVGDALESATLAMMVGIADFFPPSRRDLLLAGLSKSDAMRKLGMAKALAKLNDPALEERLITEMDRKIDEEIQSALIGLTSATNGRERSASLPTD